MEDLEKFKGHRHMVESMLDGCRQLVRLNKKHPILIVSEESKKQAKIRELMILANRHEQAAHNLRRRIEVLKNADFEEDD